MRPRGITNHFSRIAIPDTKVHDEDSFMVMLNNIRAATFEATDVAMTMAPDCLLLGMSAATSWDGAVVAERQTPRKLEGTGGIPVMLGAPAVAPHHTAICVILKAGINSPSSPFRTT